MDSHWLDASSSKALVGCAQHPTAGETAFKEVSLPLSVTDVAKWTRRAQRGGIGRGVARRDRIASNPSDLMFLKGEPIIVLLRLNPLSLANPHGDELWLAFCEGVVGTVSSGDVEIEAPLRELRIRQLSTVVEKENQRDVRQGDRSSNGVAAAGGGGRTILQGAYGKKLETTPKRKSSLAPFQVNVPALEIEAEAPPASPVAKVGSRDQTEREQGVGLGFAIGVQRSTASPPCSDPPSVDVSRPRMDSCQSFELDPCLASPLLDAARTPAAFHSPVWSSPYASPSPRNSSSNTYTPSLASGTVPARTSSIVTDSEGYLSPLVDTGRYGGPAAGGSADLASRLRQRLESERTPPPVRRTSSPSEEMGHLKVSQVGAAKSVQVSTAASPSMVAIALGHGRIQSRSATFGRVLSFGGSSAYDPLARPAPSARREASEPIVSEGSPKRQQPAPASPIVRPFKTTPAIVTSPSTTSPEVGKGNFTPLPSPISGVSPSQPFFRPATLTLRKSSSRGVSKLQISSPTLTLHTNPALTALTGIPVTPKSPFYSPAGHSPSPVASDAVSAGSIIPGSSESRESSETGGQSPVWSLDRAPNSSGPSLSPMTSVEWNGSAVEPSGVKATGPISILGADGVSRGTTLSASPPFASFTPPASPFSSGATGSAKASPVSSDFHTYPAHKLPKSKSSTQIRERTISLTMSRPSLALSRGSTSASIHTTRPSISGVRPVGPEDYREEEVTPLKNGPAFELVKPNLLRLHKGQPPRLRTSSSNTSTEDGEDEGDEEASVGHAEKGSVMAQAKARAELFGGPAEVVDAYGFVRPSTSADARPAAVLEAILNAPTPATAEAHRAREAKWLAYLSSVPSAEAYKHKGLKKLARQGVPRSLRGRVWSYVLNADEYKAPGVWEKLAARGKMDAVYDEIEKDLAKCFPDHEGFRDPNSTFRVDLRTLLQAFVQYSSQLGPDVVAYTQSLGVVAGFLLMQSPGEEAFWNLVAIVRRWLPRYWTHTMSSFKTDAAVFDGLLASVDPKVAAHLVALDVNASIYLPGQFLQLFIRTLPFDTLFRILDLFVFEGSKMLLRTGLAIFEVCRDRILACKNRSDLLDFLLHLPSDMLEPQILLPVAFTIKLKSATVVKYTKKVESGSRNGQAKIAKGRKRAQTIAHM